MLEDRIGPYVNGSHWEFNNELAMGTDGDAVRHRLRALASAHTLFMAWTIGFMDITTGIHAAMAAWIQRPSLFKLGLVPRDFLKTSLWTVADTVRLVSVNPEERILIRNEIHENARKFLYRIRRVPEACLLWQWLFPERMPNFDDGWHQDGLLFPRAGDYPELSIEVIGVGGASTSRHYTRIKDDDLIGKEAARSKATMQMAKDDHALATHLLVDPATSRLDTYGTRWAPRDLYVDMMKDEHELDVFQCGPTDAQGNALFPSRFPLEALTRIRQRIGNRRYSLQMLNESPPEGAAELSVADLNYYSRSTDQYGRKFFLLHHPGGEEEMVWLRDLWIFQTLDPNVSPDSKSSRSASVVVGLAKPRTKFAHFSILILSATAKATTPKGAIELAHHEYQFWNPIMFGVEIVAAQVALKEWMLSQYPEMMIKGLKPDRGSAKLARIRAFTTYGENGHIYIHPSLHDFVEEWEEFPTGFLDLLDALSYIPYLWSIPTFDSPSPSSWDRTRALTGIGDEIIEDDERNTAYDGRSPITGY